MMRVCGYGEEWDGNLDAVATFQMGGEGEKEINDGKDEEGVWMGCCTEDEWGV